MAEKKSSTPTHIAIILDGNRRWARQHKLEVVRGHQHVVDVTIQELVDHCIKRTISYLTLWAFSTENWNRDQAEVEGLMRIFRHFLNSNGQKLHDKGVQLRTIGDLTRFPDDIQELVTHWIQETRENTAIVVTIALSYGGRDEIARAVNRMWTEGGDDAEQLGDYLDTAYMPDPDLIIRPGGEKRLSGFLPWQSVYSELYFTDILMPDFGPAQLDEALEDYAQRQRRFGK